MTALVLVVFAGFVISMLVSTCSSTEPTKTAATTTPAAVSTPSASPEVAPETPVAVSTPSASPEVTPETPAAQVPLSHNYSYYEDGKYGYEQGISADDENAGKMANPLFMVEYLGEFHGTYKLSLPNDDGLREIYSCKAPCEFVKLHIYASGDEVGTRTIRVPEGSVIGAIVEDMLSGQLKPYKAKK